MQYRSREISVKGCGTVNTQRTPADARASAISRATVATRRSRARQGAEHQPDDDHDDEDQEDPPDPCVVSATTTDYR